jgi:hypothetical protein
MSVFIKELDTDESTWSYVLAPLSHGMWWTMVATMVILTLFLSFTWYFGDKYGDNPEDENYSLYNSWINVLASFCQQGENRIDSVPYILVLRTSKKLSKAIALPP